MAAKEPDRRPQNAHQAAEELRMLEEKLSKAAEIGPANTDTSKPPTEREIQDARDHAQGPQGEPGE